jgi:hypothetical protein
MVREFVETHGVGVAPEAVEHLRDCVSVQLDDLMKTARKTGRDTFALKPKKFEKRLTKSVRRDLTPPDDVRTNGVSE